jgi:hypothetical protein
MSARPAGPANMPRILVLACGALAREILAILSANRLEHIELQCLPASLHNQPQDIPGQVRTALREARGRYDRIFVGYGDCGTGGQLDTVLDEEGAERLPGPHCYAFYSGVERFAERGDRDMQAFFLTDFLVRQFDVLVIEGLGLDRYPELRDTYFGNYRTVIYLSQVEDAAMIADARHAASRLGLAFEHRHVGYGDLAAALTTL